MPWLKMIFSKNAEAKTLRHVFDFQYTQSQASANTSRPSDSDELENRGQQASLESCRAQASTAFRLQVRVKDKGIRFGCSLCFCTSDWESLHIFPSRFRFSAGRGVLLVSNLGNLRFDLTAQDDYLKYWQHRGSQIWGFTCLRAEKLIIRPPEPLHFCS